VTADFSAALRAVVWLWRGLPDWLARFAGSVTALTAVLPSPSIPKIQVSGCDAAGEIAELSDFKSRVLRRRFRGTRNTR
jgi:hypothetical protein